jgi:hypothetical protein
MRQSIIIFAALTVGVDVALASCGRYVDWKTFRPTGVNLGGWLEQESTVDASFWAEYGGTAKDEWTMCINLGTDCGPILEARYASFITTADIDLAASANITALRIPLHYAAFIDVPGSPLYRGNQTQYLKQISDYAINKYGSKQNLKSFLPTISLRSKHFLFDHLLLRGYKPQFPIPRQ